MSYEVAIEDYSDGHLGNLFDLFRTYFQPGDRLLTEAYSRWLYADNPFGLARMVKVTEGGRWAGFMAMIPVELARKGVSLRAYYVVNVLVDPKHQGKNLFSKMISAAKQAMAEEDFALMGHPNDMALKMWQRGRMHFHESLRPSLVLPRLWGGGLKVSQVRSPRELPAIFPALTELAKASDRWAVVVTAEYLDWRFLRHPNNVYRMQRIDAHGVPVGVQVCKRVRPGVHLLIDQFMPTELGARAISRLPLATVCFRPESVTNGLGSAVLALPWKKRIPFFLTRRHEPELSLSVAGLGLAASDF